MSAYDEAHELRLGEIDEWLCEAADTARRLPKVGHKPVGTCMPPVLREAKEIWEQALERGGRFEDMTARPSPPTASAISRFDEAMTWFAYLSKDQAAMVWARANGAKWAMICGRMHISRQGAHSIWTKAMMQIWVSLQLRKRDQQKSKAA